MTRRTADPLPGIPARHEHPCPVCEVLIVVGDRVCARRGEWLHCSCAPGGDDE